MARSSRLHVVLGKGGVGKSTVAAALAWAAQRSGLRVLALELDTAAGLSLALGVELHEAGAIVRSPSGVCVAYLEGAAALAEYLSRKVRMGPVLPVVLGHPLYRAFVAAAPGVRELMVMGKIRDELERRENGRRSRWDVLVVDAGSTGHALEHLRMPLAAMAAFASGRVQRESRRIHALLCNPQRCSVHVVTTAEEMPVAEAVDAARELRRLGITPRTLFANGCHELAPKGAEAALVVLRAWSAPDARLADARNAVLTAAGRVLGWQRIQERCLAELVHATRMEVFRLPFVLPNPSEERVLSVLSDRLLEVAKCD